MNPTNIQSTTFTIICVALICGFAQGNQARAQNNQTTTERRIVITGQNGTQEVEFNANGIDGQQVMVISINSNGAGVFSFIGSPNDLPFGGSLGPLGFFAIASGGVNGTLVPIDPGVSYIHKLINRPDVRSDLFLDSKQREQLEDMQNSENQTAQQRIDQLGIKGAPADSPGKSSGTEQNAIADRAKNLHDMVQGAADERDRKLAAILTPKQIKRLKELDLQYRGPLAMGVKPVDDKALLTETQAPAIADLLKEYRDSVRKSLGVEQKVTQSTGPDGSTSLNVNSSVSASPDEMRARLEKAHDDIEQSRRRLGDKALKSVTDTQRSEWKNITGVRFQFQSLD